MAGPVAGMGGIGSIRRKPVIERLVYRKVPDEIRQTNRTAFPTDRSTASLPAAIARRRVRERLQGTEDSGAADQSLAIEDARRLVACGHGFESWDALLAHLGP